MRVNHDSGERLWCGPAAISAATGLPTSRVTEVVRALRLQNVGGGRSARRRVVAWMYDREIAAALLALGFRRTNIRPRPQPTRKKFVERITKTTIFLSARHFICAAPSPDGVVWVDDRNHEPRPVSELGKPRARVTAFFEVEASCPQQ